MMNLLEVPYRISVSNLESVMSSDLTLTRYTPEERELRSRSSTDSAVLVCRTVRPAIFSTAT